MRMRPAYPAYESKSNILWALGLITVVCVVGIGMKIYCSVNADYEYENKIQSNWIMADRSSTLEAKSKYVDAFVEALEASGVAEKNSALIFQTPATSGKINLEAVRTLRDRLREIKQMDPQSFAYQKAIEQITAQEQGLAHEMIYVLEQCWMREHYPLSSWSPLSVPVTIILVLVGFVSVTAWFIIFGD